MHLHLMLGGSWSWGVGVQSGASRPQTQVPPPHHAEGFMETAYRHRDIQSGSRPPKWLA